ncbi:MAG: peptidyl-prolyl cis-trans isomerase [Myxococcota bacterium]|nr:peptidyl-prolyl cis-trans isomerase [Myxococcota bacterium]
MRRVILLSLSSMLACSAVAVAFAQEAEEATPAPTEEAAEPSAADRARRAKVLARVGEETITIGEVEDAINEQSPFMRVRFRDPGQLREFVESMIRFELLARAAERAEIGEHDEVRRVVNQNAVQQLIRRDFDERITPESIPEEQVRAYYDGHPEEFTRDERRRAAHIQVASREEATRLLEQAREADARAFRTLARDNSLDPETRLRGGDLRYFDDEGQPRNERDPRVDEAIARAAFAIEEVGGVAPEPVQVGERWSIVKLTGRRPPEHRSYEQAAPTIRLRLWRETRQQELEDFVAQLRERAGVEVDYDLLRPIRLDPPEREDEGDSHGEAAANAPAPPPAVEAPADPQPGAEQNP